MAVIKCKMCGAGVEMAQEETYGTCEYCGNIVTFPKVSDEQRLAAYDRGDHFRRNGDFDKALAVYEQIIRDDPSDAEAHWCCVLCRFGIEYVQNPGDSQWIPTCHRASFDSILEDVDYQAALEYSDGVTRNHYQAEAKRFSEIQKGILAISRQEEPYDIFICYKESDGRGGRTQDSVLAQDIYYQLMDAGYRIFFSRITLEDKAGTEYEPYIFAALHSAKVMLVVGTRQEYFNAVWVRNEWGRFLAMMRKDQEKLLIPCYRDMDPYDLPEALSILQAYDMAKIGFVQDLLRGLKKILYKEEEKSQQEVSRETVVIQGNSANVQALLKRGYIELEDENWEKADEFFEQVLNNDPENAEAYLGKCLSFHRAGSIEQIVSQENSVLNLSREKQESLSINHDREVVKMIADATVDIGHFQGQIKQKLLGIPLTYSSEIEYVQQVIKAYQVLTEKDKNLSRAIKYSMEGDRVDICLKEMEAQLKQDLEEVTRKAEQKEKQAGDIYDKQFQVIQQEMEYLKIYGDCLVNETLFANSKQTAEKYQCEHEEIESIYNVANRDNFEETYQRIQALSLEIFDKEIEEEQWREVCEEQRKIREENRKAANNIRVQLNEKKKKHKEMLEENDRELNYRQSVKQQVASEKENLNDVGCLFFGISFIVPPLIFIHGIYKAFVTFLAEGSGIWGIIGSHILGSIVTFFVMYIGTHAFLDLMGGKLDSEVPNINNTLNDNIAALEQEIEKEERVLASIEQKYASMLESIKLPKPHFKLIFPNIKPYRSSVALKFAFLDRAEISFHVLHMQEEKEKSVFGKQAILFCYEKESFYPVEILREADGENPDQLVLTVTNMGLSVKLEKFSDKEHYLLLHSLSSK